MYSVQSDIQPGIFIFRKMKAEKRKTAKKAEIFCQIVEPACDFALSFVNSRRKGDQGRTRGAPGRPACTGFEAPRRSLPFNLLLQQVGPIIFSAVNIHFRLGQFFFFSFSFFLFFLFFFRAHAFEDELRKDQCCLAEAQAIENAISLMKKENVVRGK